MNLLLDMGNHRIKWAYAQAGELISHGSAERGDSVSAVLAEQWLAQPRPTRIIAANVAGRPYAEQLDQWTASHWQQSVTYLTVSSGYGLELAYSKPEQFGVDRWLALIAARQLTTATSVIVDAGTAVTVDAISTQGQHLGGIIIPGLGLMADALRQKSPGIRQGLQHQSQVEVGTLGNDTSSCVAQGALYAVTGAIERLLQHVEQTQTTQANIIITGGDAGAVQAQLPYDCRHIPDLVLLGVQRVSGN